MDSERRLVSVWKMLLERQHDAVGEDGEQDHVLERRAVRSQGERQRGEYGIENE